MPVDRDGKQLTKNRKVIMMGGSNGAPRAVTPAPIRHWKQELEMHALTYCDCVHAFLTKINYVEKTPLDVRIYWQLKTFRTDPQNYNELLLDGLQLFTGINDRYYRVHVDGVVKDSTSPTSACVALCRSVDVSRDEWMDRLSQVELPLLVI
jgi:hypothetical protein